MDNALMAVAQTMERPVNPLLARAMSAPSTAKRKKGEMPRLAISEAKDLTDMFPLLVQRRKDAEAREDECGAGIIALAEPHRQRLSVEFGECLSGIVVNDDVMYLNNPPHFSTAIRGPRIGEIMAVCGDRFEKYFVIHCELKGGLPPAVRDVLDANNIPYEISIKPTKALHVDRTMDAVARGYQLEDIRPIRYVRVK